MTAGTCGCAPPLVLGRDGSPSRPRPLLFANVSDDMPGLVDMAVRERGTGSRLPG
jgi:hypothetical protein